MQCMQLHSASQAAKKGLYIGLLPVWGSSVKTKTLTRKIRICSLLAAIMLSAAARAQTIKPAGLGFDFSSAPATAGKVHVAPDIAYSRERGFGFEPGADLKQTDSAITSEKPFYFHIAIPQEGNYKVTINFGDTLSATDNTVFAELRRLMVESVHTDPGASATRTFIVNTRTPAIPGRGRVKISSRERTQEPWAWDDRLSLEFNGTHPGVRSIQIEMINVPTIYLLGDSTVCDQANEPYNSWGQMLPRFFKPEVAVANGAESGDSFAPSLSAGRFAKFWEQMKPGDYLFIQYGHNDMKSTAPDALETYANNLRRVVDETRSHSGTPVLVASVSRRTFGPDGKIANSFGGYTDAVRAVAKEKGCALIDLQAGSALFYEALGDQKSHLAFATMQEGTHHNNYGSYEIAKCIVMGIKQAKLELAKHITDDFKDFDPSHPDPVEHFKLPRSPQAANIAPLGD
jgi:lysophospholipase L1-like esterase